jgi:hypothetical protein
MKKIKKVSGLALAVVVAASGCDILDVENPNNLVQDDLNNSAAVEAVVNGGLVTVTRGIGYSAAPYSTASDELKWIGSRDAWNQLNFGFVSDPNNEFTDAGFPFINEGRWMADESIRLIEEVYLEESPGDAGLEQQNARAHVFAGMAYLNVAEMYDDFVFSNRTEEGSPKGPDNMDEVVQGAIDYLTHAIELATKHGMDELELRAYALRARAHHYAAVWGMLNPAGSSPSNPLVNSSAANADALAVVQRVGITSDWKFDLEFSSATVFSEIAFEVNERAELAIGDDYYDGTDWVLQDPVDGTADPRIANIGEAFLAGGQYSPITQASAREMHLILAEAALAQGDAGGFQTHINHVRRIGGGVSDYTGQIDATEMLIHERRVNLFLQNRRLSDQYRFGIDSQYWNPGSDAVNNNGVLLPITCIEVRANSLLQDSKCG